MHPDVLAALIDDIGIPTIAGRTAAIRQHVLGMPAPVVVEGSAGGSEGPFVDGVVHICVALVPTVGVRKVVEETVHDGFGQEPAVTDVVVDLFLGHDVPVGGLQT
ncbi:hypothetical protein [Streptomyces pinistramenti]|uniref:hypothetical protein n=1 Tax=Streptomyces pinistramenti TaxID=2884812 RepID=UPI001D094D53|nr:hypothetical protein [Streptomyces pinistramenti]MCB5906937.1 hypothetical protein [Streptomyces pinistramenti]